MSFSDHIIILLPTDENIPQKTTFMSLTYLSEIISKIYKFSLPKGILLRGSIACGKLYLNTQNNIVFGEALVEAIEGESKLALYPRVILTQSILNKLHTQLYRFEENSLKFIPMCKRDFDGMFYTNYLDSCIPTDIPIQNTEMKLARLANTIRIKIEENINRHPYKLEIYSKWHWLANYYDSQLIKWKEIYKEFQFIKELNLPKSNHHILNSLISRA